MADVIPASSLQLYEVEARFGLQQASQSSFFSEWQNVELDLDERDRYWLDRTKANFLGLIKYRLHEEIVKLSVLAPLLSVSGLGTVPFIPKAEHRVEIAFAAEASGNEEKIIRGRVDLLILYQNLWVVTIETKPQQSDVLEALPQALTYMMSAQEQQGALYALLTNGRHFMFVKLLKQEQPTYGLSELFTLFRQENELYQVAATLQHLGRVSMSRTLTTI
ncbi:MAG: restriction endonuclease subunit R [Cyanobacteria bacterium P01_D01_bin.1]